MARHLVVLPCALFLTGCAEERGEPALSGSAEPGPAEREPLDEKVRRSWIRDRESRFHNGSVDASVLGVSLGQQAEWSASFDRHPNAAWVEVLLHDKPMVAYNLTVFNGGSAEPVFVIQITDHQYQSILLGGGEPEWRVVLKPHVLEKGYCWSVAITQFYEEYPGLSFRTLPEVEDRPLPVDCAGEG